MSLDLSKYADEVSSLEPPRPLSTGSILLDSLTGIGGLPMGRIMEVFGRQSSGKSTLLYQAIAQVQKIGGVGVLLDFENAFTDEYGGLMGIDVTDSDGWLLRVPESLERGFDLALNITKKAGEVGVPLVVGFDSLEAMPMESETELNKKTGDIAVSENNMAGAWRAKAIANYLRQATPVVARAGALWILVNHEKDVIHTGFVSPLERSSAGKTRTPGGKGPKFYSSLRLQFTPTGGKIKGPAVDVVTGEVSEGVVGVKVQVEAVKNKVGPPFRKAMIEILFGKGIDNVGALFEIGVGRGVIEKSGNTYRLAVDLNGDGEPDAVLSRVGRDAFVGALRESPEAQAYLGGVLRPLVEEAMAGISPTTVPSEED